MCQFACAVLLVSAGTLSVGLTILALQMCVYKLSVPYTVCIVDDRLIVVQAGMVQPCSNEELHAVHGLRVAPENSGPNGSCTLCLQYPTAVIHRFCIIL